ncbi:MAG: PilZ domain-containing protein [Pseudomonadota bacterium]
MQDNHACPARDADSYMNTKDAAISAQELPAPDALSAAEPCAEPADTESTPEEHAAEHAAEHAVDQNADSSDQRAAPRFTLLIRAAKLVSPNGEFVCVIRDVSETGVSVRLFHTLPKGSPIELHMPSGGTYELEPVWERDNEVGFRFAQTVDVSRLISEAGEYPKRGLRLEVCFPVRISTLTQRAEGLITNLSQQGARIECDGLFAIDQNLRIGAVEPIRELSEVRAKVRWRRDRDYGLVFDDTFSLSDFARLAARLQSPGLLDV